MKNKLFFGLIVFLLIFSLLSCKQDDPIDYYDHAGVGVSVSAFNMLTGYYTNTVYIGNNAHYILGVVSTYPASNSNDTYYKKRTYDQVISWLNDFGLPKSIATRAKDSLSAFCYYDVSGNLWAVFVEDVSEKYRSILTNNILENNIIQKEGFIQEKKVFE